MLFKNSVRTSKRTPHFTITKINMLTLFKFNPLKPKINWLMLFNPLKPKKRERERERKKEHNFVRRFPGHARSSFW
jgi:hypothetical protein